MEPKNPQEAFEERKERFAAWIQNQGKEPFPPDSEKFLEAIKDYLIFGDQSSHRRLAIELLKKAKAQDPDFLSTLLSKAGVIQEDENFWTLKYHVPREFPPEVEKEASALLGQAPVVRSDRRDLTGVHAFTIDDPTTTDMDDALSFEMLPEGFRIGIHISDAAEWIPKDSQLDKEAHARSTSIYLPDEKIQMLPEKITEAASLLEGKNRPALTLLVSLDSQGRLSHWEIMESFIQVKERLTYEAVNSALSHSPVFEKLYQLALQFQAERTKAGALFFNFPKIEIHRDPNTKEIFLTKPKLRTPSQILVGEWMILANRLVAEFCRKSSIPVIFRSQRASEKIVSPEPDDWVSLWKQRFSLRKAEASTTPSPHSGLGLPAYLQMTSPLRRYSDLVIHRQLKAFLRKQPLPYEMEDLEAILAYSERWIEISDLVERESRKYWLFKYLESKVGSRLEAVVLEEKSSEMVLFLPELAMEVSCPKNLKQHFPGEKLQVSVALAKPRAGILKVIPC